MMSYKVVHLKEFIQANLPNAKRFTDSTMTRLSILNKKDSRTKTIIHWMTEEQILGTTKSSTDSTLTQNSVWNEQIHRLKQWFTEWHRSKSLAQLNDSLTQILIHKMNQISLMTKWFTESNND